MTSAAATYRGLTVNDNYQGRTPFASDMLAGIVDAYGFDEDSKIISGCLDTAQLVRGGRIPSTQVMLGCDPDQFSSYGVIYQTQTDGRTVTTVEHGDIKDVIANAAVLTSYGKIYNVHIFGYDVKTGSSETVTQDPELDIGEDFDRLESDVTSASLDTPISEESAAFKLCEHMMTTNTLQSAVNTLLDSATVTVYEHCPMEGHSDITEAIDLVRTTFFWAIRQSFR
ncbi:hypothetical protein AUP07_0406 [methanogenic archaeon mixed culture ISO4-G1]|nr:hypothetical protein AUP07_0406 [methanogenic archaeon mixed culture ISO4-G1]